MEDIHTRPGTFRSLCLFSVLSVLILAQATVHVTPVRAQGVTVGLYTDESGSTCSFSGDDTGLISAYVVVRPGGVGVRGVRFAAPIPDCFKATYVGDVVPGWLASIGESQTGISITSATCETDPFNVLQIMYMRAGGTTPCCPYPLVPEATVGYLEAVDCSFNSVAMSSMVSHFNADETCPCAQVPPVPPFNPTPANHLTQIYTTPTLQWDCTDYDGDLAEYDVYFGTDSLPPLVATGVTEKSYQPAPIALQTTYFWRIVARDSKAQETSGPVWDFTTAYPVDQDQPPLPPYNPGPADHSMGQSLTTTLTWSATDFNDNIKEYDVYFGTDPDPPLSEAGVTVKSYDLPPLTKANYYWRVVVRDSTNLEASGPVWTFSTDHPPTVPDVVSPLDNATGVSVLPVLDWDATDPDGDALLYDVFLGTTPTPPLLVSGMSESQLATDQLDGTTTYYWRVIAHDPLGAASASPTWTFTTEKGNHRPTQPVPYYPLDGATDVAVWRYFNWTCSDPDSADVIHFDVYFGTDPSPPLVQADQAGYLYQPPNLLDNSTTYYWRIVAKDSHGGVTSGPVWTFTTAANSPPTLAMYGPADGWTNANPAGATLTWQGQDNDQQTLTYDVYFGTDPSPPLVTTLTGGKLKTYPTGLLSYTTQYYWKIVVRDTEGAETAGPIWTFTSTGNTQPPVFNTSGFNPANNSLVIPTTTLSWQVSDPEGRPVTCDLYFGTVSPPPLLATSVNHPYSPGSLSAGTTYYWQLVASDGELETASNILQFTAVEPGDVDQDGSITVADAACALQVFFSLPDFAHPLCGGANGATLADANCDHTVTPADARCIHKHAVDGSCDFCTGGSAAPLLDPATPVVTSHAWIEWDTLVVRLSVSGVPSFKSFGFEMSSDPNLPLSRITRVGATTGFEAFDFHRYSDQLSIVGGYTLGETDATGQTEFIELRTYLPQRTFTSVSFFAFRDDLAGQNAVIVYGNSVPVLFTSFNAAARNDGVNVSWQLHSDEAMDSYTLYRRDGDASAEVPVAQGAVTSSSGSYFDRSVTAGATYHYEMAVRTTGGDVFRSPVADATMVALTLALYQNHPNPFNPQTTIRYDLPPGSVRVRLWILDVAGHIVRTLVDEAQSGGARSVVWNGTDDRGAGVSSGVYFYVLEAGKERRTHKLVLLK